MRGNLSFLSIAKATLEGVLVALLPGGHPLLLGRRPFFEIGIIYGFYTALSLWIAQRGVVKPETAGGRFLDSLSATKVLLKTLLIIPLAYFLYSISLPDWLVLGLLVTGSLHLLSIPFLLSGIMGLVAFRWSTVADPLGSGFLYMFGLGEWKDKENEKDDKGVLAAFLTGFIPGLPPSAWTKILGGGGVSSAAIAGPLFSLVAFLHGKTRSAMVASLQSPDIYVVTLTGFAYVLSLLMGLILAKHINVTFPRSVVYGLLLGHAFLNGLQNILLLLASYALAKMTKNPSQLFGFIILPTILYYYKAIPS